MGRADGLSRLPISVIFQEPTGADCTELATDDTEGLATQSEGVEGTQVSTTRMMEATRIKPNEPYRMRQSVRETRRMRADTDSCEADTMRTALTERMGLDVLSPEVKLPQSDSPLDDSYNVPSDLLSQLRLRATSQHKHNVGGAVDSQAKLDLAFPDPNPSGSHNTPRRPKLSTAEWAWPPKWLQPGASSGS
ncbi:hypothetical protein H257_18557 [Aphanomyces astaci]|uniref:Uncharacterized protein n=1 Tax=Aphanomyces astaci TaxID=112090 RepID=W4FCF9_APHAT|nr:hypothetical protein H257_18557 [Aphanomyces astaci]ETV64569.1 hypothetical protein H257_18557 [Aphanomyces astaci]|eukprot:XP_009845950.1 hypothetical protein H257_18557 [Aphanomyces astaci]